MKFEIEASNRFPAFLFVSFSRFNKEIIDSIWLPKKKRGDWVNKVLMEQKDEPHLQQTDKGSNEIH
jgi:hypothetical protein